MAAFVGIAALFTATSLVAMRRAAQVEETTRSIVGDTEESILLADRMGRDTDQIRILIAWHIFEREGQHMSSLEEQIRRLELDFDAAAKDYSAMVSAPEEAQVWKALTAQVDATRGPLHEVLRLSKLNEDAAARDALLQLEGRFTDMDQLLAVLVRVNREDAAMAELKVGQLHRSASTLFGIMAAAGIVLTLLVGVGISRGVHAHEEQLRQYSAALELRNRELDAFAGRVAHDLRGPLTLVGMAGAQLAKQAPAEVSTADMLKRGLQRMESLIEDLLALSRLGGQLHSGACDVALAVERVREDLASRLQEEGVALSAAIDPASVRCNEGLLGQALWNLLDNAIKYRRPGATAKVEIAGSCDRDGYLLKVSDNGQGMSTDDINQAFDPFYRAARTRETPGTGLGLSIVKRIVEASGGTVAVQSRLGEGSTFAIRLPLA